MHNSITGAGGSRLARLIALWLDRHIDIFYIFKLVQRNVFFRIVYESSADEQGLHLCCVMMMQVNRRV